MLVNICGALAYALMYPWIPAEPDKEMQDPSSPSPTVTQSPVGGKKGGKPAPPAASPAKGKAPAPSTQVTISPEAMPDLKKAIEVCLRSPSLIYILNFSSLAIHVLLKEKGIGPFGLPKNS